MVTNTTVMLEDARKWEQRFHTRVIDPNVIAAALEACADARGSSKLYMVPLIFYRHTLTIHTRHATTTR